MTHLIYQLFLAMGGLVALLTGWLLVERLAGTTSGTAGEHADPSAYGACGRGCGCGSEAARPIPAAELPAPRPENKP